MLQALVLFFWLVTSPCLAAIHVVFFRGDFPLEPGDQFTHVAISFRGKWLHAHPERGVELTHDFSGLGKVATVLENNKIAEIDPTTVQNLIGRKYDPFFNWEDETSRYCSELVAKLFGVQPTPMEFKGKHWLPWQTKNKGKAGISPDELYKALLDLDFKVTQASCDSIFI